VKKPYKTLGILLAVAIALIIVVRIATRGRGEATESISDIQKREGVPVRVETATTGSIARSLQFSGTIEGEEQSVVVARVMEVARAIPVRVGQRVSRGDVVARLDETNPQAMYRQARSSRDDAKTDLERMQALFDQGAVSRQALDKARLALDIAQSNLDAAADLVVLRAPVSGEVVRVHLQPGEMASPGQPIVTIAASKQVRVKFRASAEERRRIQKGQLALIHLSLSDTSSIEAAVDKAEDAADPSTRLFEITVTSENPEGRLKPGVLTNVDVVIEQRQDVLTVNREALMGTSGHHEIYALDETGHARKRTVTVGLETARRAEIVNGLKVGERVIVYGQNRLADGDLVKVVES